MSYSFELFCQLNLTCTRSFAAIQSSFVPAIVKVNVSQFTPSTHRSSSITPPGLTNAPFHVPSQGLTGPLVPIAGFASESVPPDGVAAELRIDATIKAAARHPRTRSKIAVLR